MKRSRAILWIGISFIAGCISHGAYSAYRFEKSRGELEAYYQTVFRFGDDFEKISGPQKDGFIWRYDQRAHRYDAILPPDVARRLHLRIEVDEQQKIQKVSVVTVILK